MRANGSVPCYAVGQTATYARYINDADVALFALITDDRHPLHLDTAYAATTPLGQRTIPVMLIMGLIEAAFARTIPGIAAFIRQQTMQILGPAYIDEEITITITITAISADQREVQCQAVAARSDGTVMLESTTGMIIESLPPPESDGTDEHLH